MARRVVTTLVSDVSGEPADDNAGETIQFAYRETSYTIDLTSAEAAAFDQVLAPYLTRATKTNTHRSIRNVPSKNATPSAGTNPSGFVPGHARTATRSMTADVSRLRSSKLSMRPASVPTM